MCTEKTTTRKPWSLSLPITLGDLLELATLV